MVKAPFKAMYRALADGWVAGRWVQAGELLELSLEEAKYEPVEPEKPAAAKRSSEAPSS